MDKLTAVRDQRSASNMRQLGRVVSQHDVLRAAFAPLLPSARELTASLRDAAVSLEVGVPFRGRRLRTRAPVQAYLLIIASYPDHESMTVFHASWMGGKPLCSLIGYKSPVPKDMSDPLHTPRGHGMVEGIRAMREI